MNTIKYYTTEIAASKSISEIQGLLARSGATRVMFEYNDTGDVKALVFMLKVNDREMPFKLPAKPEAVYKILYAGKEIRFYDQKKVDEVKRKRLNQSLNTAWRIMKEWIEMQFALIELDQADAAEIFMPYLMVSNTKTLYEANKESGFISLMPKNE